MPGLPNVLPFNETLGETIPPDTPHVNHSTSHICWILKLTRGQAVSVSLPTWRSNVGYEEGEKWVVERMQCGYPRYEY